MLPLPPQVDQTVGLLDGLLSLHRDVVLRSTTLSGSCDNIIKEKASLAEFADALRARLKFFDEYEAVAGQFAAVQAAPDGAMLLPLLSRLDECIAYVGKSKQAQHGEIPTPESTAVSFFACLRSVVCQTGCVVLWCVTYHVCL